MSEFEVMAKGTDGYWCNLIDKLVDYYNGKWRK
jgi:hypothetical protein